MRWLRNLVFTILLLAGFGVVGYYYIDYTLQSPIRSNEIKLKIPPHTTLKEIGSILEENNLIRDSRFFRYYAIYKGKTNLIAGNYIIDINDNLDDILEKIAAGKQDIVKVDIPTGFTVDKIANRLEAKLHIKKEDFYKEVNRSKAQFEFEKQIPVNQKGRKYKLEGYLYPAAYEFRKGDTAEQVVNAMLSKFEQETKKLDYKNGLSSRHLTLDQWVIYASLLEKEAFDPEELPTIASVIQNRLKAGMELKIDASVVYAFSLTGQKKERLTYNDLEIKSPYNLYQMKGLPIGPIASPSQDALLAVLKPANTKYLYYCAKNDGTGQHYFAITGAEHEQNVKKSKENAKKQ